MPRMPQRTLTAALVTGTTVLATALAAGGTANAAPTQKAVPNSKPAWTAHAKHYGHAKSTAAVQARVYLSPRGGMTALKQFASAVSTPGSASYRKFLTPSQYQARFGATDASVKSVSSYLRSSGLKVTGVGANNRFVTVSGTVKAANKAFGTSIDRYKHGTQQVQAPASAVKVPSTVAGNVLTVTGLDTTVLRAKPNTTKAPAAAPPAGFRSGRPCSLYYGQLKATYKADYKTKLPTFENQTLPYAPCGYTGMQLRTAYEGGTTLDGSGVTIGIVDAYAAPTILKDANTYASAHGDGTFASGQFVQSKPASYTHQADCGPSGWYGEETLDVEAAHAMAPNAKIHYYASRSCYDPDFIDTLAQTVTDDDAQLISNSWGGVEEGESADQIAAYEQIFLQGATQGQSFLFSSGDNGDELANTGLKQADYPTSDPYVTSVGGTSTAIGCRRQPAVADRLGHREVLAVLERQVVDPGRVPVRRRRRDVLAVPAAELPGRRHQRRGPAGAGRRHGRRPEHRHARR